MTRLQAERRFNRIVRASPEPIQGKRIIKNGKVIILRKGEQPTNGWKEVK